MKTTAAVILAIVSAGSASPLQARTTTTSAETYFNGTCTADTLRVRKEWRNMEADEKTAYLAAENCLINLPAKTDLDAVTNRFSDLQSLHRWKTNTTIDGIYVQDIVHPTGQFLPWHRYYMHTHETMLRTECNYTGPMTWWDEAKDADSGNFFQSNMWDADAFGGNGTATDSCVVDGAFANYTEHIGPLLENTDYCLKRNWNSTLGVEQANSEVVAACTAHDNYYDFLYCWFNGPHVVGHTATGGIMADIDCSPGDPMFFMHHNYVDRIWWQWQTANASARMFEISGYMYNISWFEQFGPDDALETLTAETGILTTLDYQLNVADILPDVPISEVMNAQGGLLCYEYDY